MHKSIINDFNIKTNTLPYINREKIQRLQSKHSKNILGSWCGAKDEQESNCFKRTEANLVSGVVRFSPREVFA